MRIRISEHLIIPLSILIHVAILNSTLILLTPDTYFTLLSILYYNFSWFLICYVLNFYPTRRRESFMTNIRKMIHLYLLFGLAYMASFTLLNKGKVDVLFQVYVLIVLYFFLTIYRWLFYWSRSKYRRVGGNYANVVVVGWDSSLKKIRRVFDHPSLGYRYLGFFSDSLSKSPTYLGKVEGCIEYLRNNKVDELFCTASRISQKELQSLISFADNNFIKVKVIPDNKEIFNRAMSLQMFDFVPVIDLRRIPLNTGYSKVVKRIFDIVFSSLVILLILSWLTPILYVLIKLDSPGNLYFKQKRHGLNQKVFWCYKFRSMRVNKESNTKMAVKNDMRVTPIGKFLRKTSIDELPQFYNVFLGNMSVVGPRPHMESHTQDYSVSVDKYLVRHFVKPGITGLAQVKGYRGEVRKPSDIINRIRWDIFYVERWTMLLDMKIIYQTVFNVFNGEKNAY